jgi:ribose transport system permease protein
MARAFLERWGTALAAALVFLVFAISADNFIAFANLVGIVKQITTIAILGTGFTLALTTGELDLSFASITSLAAIVTGMLVQRGLSPIAAIAAGLGTGLGCGVFNGATDGVSVVGRWPRGFTDLGRGTFLGLPALIWWTLGVALCALVLLKETRVGFRLTCTGEAEEAAARAGVPVRRMKLLGLALSGLCAGLAAVLMAASLSSAAPNMAGDSLLTAIAAVMLGMTMVEPGRPNIPGTFIGALTIGMLSNGLVLLGAPYYVQDICLGLIIIASVALSASVMTRAAFR